MEQKSNQTMLKAIITVALVIFNIAIYFVFGFFFDVFLEIIPILLFSPVMALLIWYGFKDIKKTAVIVVATILVVVSIGGAVGVGIVATSVPYYGVDTLCGSVESFTYSRQYMQTNYSIPQQTKINVWLPKDYKPTKQYPVMYILDGDNKFNYASVKASEYSQNGEGDMIVVGIGYGYWNATFARGGLIWQDEKNKRGRWRDFNFADDTEADFMPGTIIGGEHKKGKEYTSFIVETVVKDIEQRYSIDKSKSMIYGHSLGGGLAAYFVTQYNPQLGNANPFSHFAIVDNGYVEYYGKKFKELESNMAGGSAHQNIYVYRIWGGAVNPIADGEQIALCDQINQKGWSNVNSYIYIPSGANHGDTITIGIDSAQQLLLGKDFPHQ